MTSERSRLADEYGLLGERGNPGTSGNGLIRTAWERGLAVLKPTAAQLEHGLALHRSSLVIDTFGFLPVGWNERAVNEINAMIDAGISGNDYHFREGIYRTVASTYDKASEREFLEAIWCTGLTGTMHSAGEGKCTEEDVKRIAAASHLCGWFGDHIRQARQPCDFERAHGEKAFCVGFSVNGPPITGHLNELEDETRWLDAWYQFGVRMMHLSYNRRNAIATGCAERNDAGLSELGYEFVREMNRVGIIVDVPHSSERTALQAAETSLKPIMASHVCCRALYDHMRNKSDGVLKAIAGTNGLVGITSRPSFMGPNASIEIMLNHIDHAVKVVGIDHVGIGTDTTYVPPVPAGLKKRLPSSFTPRWWGAWERQRIHASTASEDHRTGSLAWTNWPLMTVGLVMRGYRDAEIQKILGLNLLRVLKDNLPTDVSPQSANLPVKPQLPA